MELEEAAEAQVEAMEAIVRGDAEPAKAIYSRADDATLANPWGPTVRGGQATREMLDFVGTMFRDGVSLGRERLAAYVDGNVATIVENERWRAKVRGAEEASSFALRVSTTFRREGATWKVVLRHADPITAPRETGPPAD
jgi:ketosteroid isomerase-like protein